MEIIKLFEDFMSSAAVHKKGDKVKLSSDAIDNQDYDIKYHGLILVVNEVYYEDDRTPFYTFKTIDGGYCPLKLYEWEIDKD